QADWDKARGRLAQDLADLKAERAAAEERLTGRTEEARDLDKKLAAAGRRVAGLEAMVREKEALAADRGRRGDELAEKLDDANARLKKAQPLADLVPGLRDEVKDYRDKLASAEAMREKEAGKGAADLAAARKSVQDAEAARRVLERDLAAKDRELTAARG